MLLALQIQWRCHQRSCLSLVRKILLEKKYPNVVHHCMFVKSLNQILTQLIVVNNSNTPNLPSNAGLHTNVKV